MWRLDLGFNSSASTEAVETKAEDNLLVCNCSDPLPGSLFYWSLSTQSHPLRFIDQCIARVDSLNIRNLE
ncbi:hypothetical protein L204_106414 [Cryptococcus depauperatus]